METLIRGWVVTLISVLVERTSLPPPGRSTQPSGRSNMYGWSWPEHTYSFAWLWTWLPRKLAGPWSWELGKRGRLSRGDSSAQNGFPLAENVQRGCFRTHLLSPYLRSEGFWWCDDPSQGHDDPVLARRVISIPCGQPGKTRLQLAEVP
jgi:hypothetical protein